MKLLNCSKELPVSFSDSSLLRVIHLILQDVIFQKILGLLSKKISLVLDGCDELIEKMLQEDAESLSISSMLALFWDAPHLKILRFGKASES